MHTSEPRKTPLFTWHQGHGGRIVDFGGWALPVQYTSIIEEHSAVRRDVGLFDISHMGRLGFHGPGALEWLETTTTNHVGALSEGQIQYSLMTREDGGILDDVLVYGGPFGYTMVCNASNREKVLAQLHANRPDSEAVLTDRTFDTAMIAIQGPKALAVVRPLFDQPLDDLAYYHSRMGKIAGVETVLSRTGYTGEDGLEVMISAARAEAVWSALLESGSGLGIRACGLGARDTLRFEAAMPLYGHELLETINPFEAGLGSFVKLDKGDFIGRGALAKQKAAVSRKRVGLALGGKRIARQDCAVLHDGRPVGVVTSGTFAPTLQRSLAMALVAIDCASLGTALTVDVRGNAEPAEVVKLPFYRRSRA